MAAFGVAAFVLCFALAGTTQIAAGFADKKAYNKGYRALRKGDFQEAEKIFRELLGKDAHDVEARLGLSFALLKQRNLQGSTTMRRECSCRTRSPHALTRCSARPSSAR